MRIRSEKEKLSHRQMWRGMRSHSFYCQDNAYVPHGYLYFEGFKHNTEGSWQGPVSNAFAHCSRVGIVLPGMENAAYTKEGERSLINAYTGKMVVWMPDSSYVAEQRIPCFGSRRKKP